MEDRHDSTFVCIGGIQNQVAMASKIIMVTVQWTCQGTLRWFLVVVMETVTVTAMMMILRVGVMMMDMSVETAISGMDREPCYSRITLLRDIHSCYTDHGDDGDGGLYKIGVCVPVCHITRHTL